MRASRDAGDDAVFAWTGLGGYVPQAGAVRFYENKPHYASSDYFPCCERRGFRKLMISEIERPIAKDNDGLRQLWNFTSGR